MVYIKFEEITPTRAKVYYTLHDLSLLEPSGIQGGYEVNLPEELPFVAGKSIELYTNPVDRTVWYEYADRPLTDKEAIEQLKAQNAQIILSLVINDLI